MYLNTIKENELFEFASVFNKLNCQWIKYHLKNEGFPKVTCASTQMTLGARTSAESKKTAGKCNITHRFGDPS